MSEHVDFFDALVRYEIALWNAVDTRLQSVPGLSLARVEALRVLERYPANCRVQEVANDLSITVGAASKLADRLEREGLARRLANPGDRRSSFLELTDNGRAILDTGHALFQTVLRESLSPALDAGELTKVTDQLRLLTRTLSSDFIEAKK